MGTLFSCYGLFSPSTGRTYIGMTTDTHRRVRQHRGDLAGGARATRVARDWQMVFALTGFPPTATLSALSGASSTRRATGGRAAPVVLKASQRASAPARTPSPSVVSGQQRRRPRARRRH